LSDLHFGWGTASQEIDDLQLTLDSLLDAVAGLKGEWRPNCICISGDIGGKGAEGDYQQAKRWLDKLLGRLKLSTDALIICPGNHDVNKIVAGKYEKPDGDKVADEILGTDPLPARCTNPFKGFMGFCTEMGLTNLTYGDSTSPLVGTRDVLGVRFIVLNSAWFSRGNEDEDRGNLWVGLPHIRHMEAAGQLPQIGVPSDSVTVVLMHHSREYLADSECNSYGYRPATVDYLAERCDLLLTGHSHGGVRRADRIADAMWHLSGGASFAGAQHPNSFRLIRVEPDRFVWRAFEFDPRSSDQGWHPKRDAETMPFSGDMASVSVATGSRVEMFAQVRRASSGEALKLIENRSRQIKPDGDLPDILDRPVAVSAPEEQPRERGLLQPATVADRVLQVPLDQAVAMGRRCLLLGDLGAGKTTLAAKLIASLAENDGTMPLLVPAAALESESCGTVQQLICKVSEYVSEQLIPDQDAFDLKDVLANQIEVTLIVDGLDELSRSNVSPLLKTLDRLVAHWPNIRVLATGRPVELHGVSFQNWQILRTLPLTDDERILLFKAEAISQGKQGRAAAVIAGEAARSLKNRPSLSMVATTPLATRLLFRRLSALEMDDEHTLGDLLLDLLYERLGRWGERSGRQSTTPRFDAEFPEPSLKAKILGRIAIESILGGVNSREQAIDVVEQAISGLSSGVAAVASEAVSYFESAGLLGFSGGVRFPLQPLKEVAAGIGLLQKWRTDGDTPSSMSVTEWRTVSFAGTAARRLNVVSDIKKCFTEFIDLLLAEPGGLPTACYIVAEIMDPLIAKETVVKFDQLGPKPLTVYREEEAVSARAVAETLHMAGDSGFDWFYREYLDPKYPYTRLGSAIYGRIFENWAYVSHGSLDDRKKDLLGRIVRPHLIAGTHQVLDIVPALSMLVPEAFDEADRLWFQSWYIRPSFFGAEAREALRLAFEAGNGDLVNNVLVARAGGHWTSAAILWLSLNPGTVPPIPILKAILRGFGHNSTAEDVTGAISDCSQRLGEAHWLAIVRWFLSDSDSHLAGTSAVWLHQMGQEKRLRVLGEPLLHATHDGGYNPAAEDVLGKLLDETGLEGLKWLVSQFSRAYRPFDGAHSSWWRLLLARIDIVDSEGPRILAGIIGAIGPYTIPRYPEIRSALRQLLRGDRSTEYRAELRQKLVHMEPPVRLGAAMVLAVSDPDAESQALDVIIRARPGEQLSNWHDWESFLLSMRFAPSVLAFVASRLGSYVSCSIPMALAVLESNDWELTLEERHTLLESLLDIGNWSLRKGEDAQSLLASEEAFQVLIEVLATAPDRLRTSAAQALTRFHSERLAPDQEAKCLLLVTSSDPRSHPCIQALLMRLSSDTTFAERIERLAKDTEGKDAQAPLLELLRRALQNDHKWRDVLWTLFVPQRLGMDVDYSGQMILLLCQQEPQWASAIGRAATQILEDERVTGSRLGEALNWIALLGHEYGDLPADKLKERLQTGRVVHNSSVAAIIARLRPEEIDWAGRESSGSPPTGLSNKPTPGLAKAEIGAKLLDFSQAGDVHPETCKIVEAAIACDSFSYNTLSVMGKGGVPGALISSALRLATGKSPGIKESLILMGARRNVVTSKDHNFGRLLRIWHCHVSAHIHEGKGWRAKLIRAIHSSLTETDYGKADLAGQIMLLGSEIPSAHIQLVLESCAEFPWSVNDETGAEFVKWFAKDHSTSKLKAIVTGLGRAISVLDEKPWDDQADHRREAFVYLLFSLAYWALRCKDTVACSRVFLRGVKFLLLGAEHNAPGPTVQMAAETLADLEPLIAKVDTALPHSALRHGLASEDPVLRAVCRLFVLR